MPHINFFDFNSNYLSLLKKPELAYTGKLTDEKTWKAKSYHKHQKCCEIMLIVQGSGFIFVEGKRFSFKKGDIVVYNDDIRHMEDLSGSEEPPVIYYAVIENIHVDGLEEYCLLPGNLSPVFSSMHYYARIKYYFENLFSECDSKELGYGALCSGLLHSLLVYVVRLINDQYQTIRSCNKQALEFKIRDYINANYMHRISLNEIASNCFISQSYLVHLFKDSFGVSPIEYLIQVRMEKASELLTSTDYSVSKIAGMLGYDNSSYFCIAFKKVNNCTPSEYREKTFSARA